MSEAVLVLNSGSSSIKFALFSGDRQPTRKSLFCDGSCEGIDHRIRFAARDGSGAQLLDGRLPEGSSHEDALEAVLGWLKRYFPQHELIGSGHRVVHGGTVYAGPVRIDADVVAALTRLVPLAPLHQPHHLAAIAALSKLDSDLPQVACFDTSFHHT